MLNSLFIIRETTPYKNKSYFGNLQSYFPLFFAPKLPIKVANTVKSELKGERDPMTWPND